MKSRMAVFMIMALLMAGCSMWPFSTQQTNSGWNVLPRVDPDYSAPICDQTRATICSMVNLDAVSAFMKDYFQFSAHKGSLTREDAHDMVQQGFDLLDKPGVDSGFLMTILENHPDAWLIASIAENHGFNLDAASGSTYILQPEDIETVKKYLNAMDLWIDTKMIVLNDRDRGAMP